MERKKPETPMNVKAMTKQAELEELRRRMEARAARAKAAEEAALASSNIEELRRRLAARKAAAEQGIEYDSSTWEHRNGGCRETHRPVMERVAEYAYACAPAVSGLLVLLLGFISVRAMAVRAVGGMRTGTYTVQPVLAAGYAADLADPFAGPPQAGQEATQLQEIPAGIAGEFQGPIREAAPDGSAVYDDTLDAVPESLAETGPQELPAEAAASEPVREEPPAEQHEDTEFPPELIILPEEADGEAIPPEPVLPEVETMLPQDEMPAWLVPVQAQQDDLPDAEADEMPAWLLPVTESDALPDSSPAGEPESAAEPARQETAGEMLPEEDTGDSSRMTR